MSESHEGTHETSEAHGHDEHEGHVHVMPVRVLVTIFVALLDLTWVTVAATWVDFGQWSILVARAIAVVKGSLVGLYFMHLRYDAPFNGVILVTALVFVALFIGIALLDTIQYSDSYEVPRSVELTQ